MSARRTADTLRFACFDVHTVFNGRCYCMILLHLERWYSRQQLFLTVAVQKRKIKSGLLAR